MGKNINAEGKPINCNGVRVAPNGVSIGAFDNYGTPARPCIYITKDNFKIKNPDDDDYWYFVTEY